MVDRLERAGDQRLVATALLREIRERGYDGGLTQLKVFLRAVRPVPPPERLIRFETPPGQQMQVDFVVLRRGILSLTRFPGHPHSGGEEPPHEVQWENNVGHSVTSTSETWFGA